MVKKKNKKPKLTKEYSAKNLEELDNIIKDKSLDERERIIMRMLKHNLIAHKKLMEDLS